MLFEHVEMSPAARRIAPAGGGGGGGGVGAVTVIAADALLPPAEAVIDADPAATPVTRPEADTVAIVLLELVQVNDPADGLDVAVS